MKKSAKNEEYFLLIKPDSSLFIFQKVRFGFMNLLSSDSRPKFYNELQGLFSLNLYLDPYCEVSCQFFLDLSKFTVYNEYFNIHPVVKIGEKDIDLLYKIHDGDWIDPRIYYNFRKYFNDKI